MNKFEILYDQFCEKDGVWKERTKIVTAKDPYHAECEFLNSYEEWMKNRVYVCSVETIPL